MLTTIISRKLNTFDFKLQVDPQNNEKFLLEFKKKIKEKKASYNICLNRTIGNLRDQMFLFIFLNSIIYLIHHTFTKFF